MARVATLGSVLLLVVALVTPADVLAQTKDDTIVYAMQSDVQNWDPAELGPAREHHPRLQRLRPSRRARSQDRQGGAEPGRVVEERWTTRPGRSSSAAA